MLPFRQHFAAALALFLAAHTTAFTNNVRGQELAGEDSKAALDKASEAFTAAASLRTGHGKGTYKKFYKKPMQLEWTAHREADIETFFEDRRFHIDLRFRREPMNYTRRVIIYDKTAVLTTRFGPGIRPVGGETWILPPESHPLGLVRPALADFPWDISQLPATLLNIVELRKKIKDEAITVAQTPNGDWEFRYRVTNSPKLVVAVEASRDAAFHIASYKVLVDGRKEPATLFTAKWAKWGDDTWYVKSLVEEFNLKDQSVREELDYDTFEPNAKIDPKLFTEAALDMPPGSRIIDQRPNVDPKNRIRKLPKADAEIN